MKVSIKQVLLLLLLIQYCFHLPAQNQHQIDSLKNFVKTTTNDTAKVSALVSLSALYQYSDLDKAFKYSLEALTISTQLNDPNSIGKSHNSLGDAYWYKNDLGSSSEHYFNALKIYERLNDKAAIADCYRNIGWIYIYQKNYIEALNYHNKSLSINQLLKRKLKEGENYNDIGVIYRDQKNITKQLKCFIKH
jgi:tetratricopeptide (TPR) repeat protein